MQLLNAYSSFQLKDTVLSMYLNSLRMTYNLDDY